MDFLDPHSLITWVVIFTFLVIISMLYIVFGSPDEFPGTRE